MIGLGTIGGVAAGCLAAAGRHDVVACMRQPIERLTLERPDGTVELPLRALTDPAQAKPVDWVLLCTKTHQTAAAAPWLAQLCTPATRVAVLQNGIDHVARVAPLANGATVLPVIVYYNGERLAPDRVRLRRAGSDRIWWCRRRRRARFRRASRRHAAARPAQRRLRHAGLAQASDQCRRQSDHHA